jgi:hypothetical protein
MRAVSMGRCNTGLAGARIGGTVAKLAGAVLKGDTMRKWQRLLGTVLIYLPIVMLTSIALLAFFATAALGMEFHVVSKSRFYVKVAIAALLFFASVVAGIQLRRSARQRLH